MVERVLRFPEPKMARRVGSTAKLGSQIQMRDVFNNLYAEGCGQDMEEMKIRTRVLLKTFMTRYNLFATNYTLRCGWKGGKES